MANQNTYAGVAYKGPFVVTKLDPASCRTRVAAGPFADLAGAHKWCDRHQHRFKHLLMIDKAAAFGLAADPA